VYICRIVNGCLIEDWAANKRVGGEDDHIFGYEGNDKILGGLGKNHLIGCPTEYESRAATSCPFIEDANWQVVLVGVELSKVVVHAFIF